MKKNSSQIGINFSVGKNDAIYSREEKQKNKKTSSQIGIPFHFAGNQVSTHIEKVASSLGQKMLQRISNAFD